MKQIQLLTLSPQSPFPCESVQLKHVYLPIRLDIASISSTESTKDWGDKQYCAPAPIKGPESLMVPPCFRPEAHRNNRRTNPENILDKLLNDQIFLNLRLSFCTTSGFFSCHYCAIPGWACLLRNTRHH